MNNANITNKENENGDIEVEEEEEDQDQEENKIIWPSAKLLKDDKRSLNK